MVNNNSADIVGTNKVNENVDTNKLPGNDIDTSNNVESENTKTVNDRMLNDIDTDNTVNKDTNNSKNAKYDGRANLIPFNQLTESERKEIASRAGIASGEARKKKKDLREIAKLMLSVNMNDEQIVEVLGNAQNLLDGDKSLAAVLTARMAQEAGKGNYKAYEVLRDTAGYKPKEQMEIETFTEYDRQLLDNVSKRLPNKKA